MSLFLSWPDWSVPTELPPRTDTIALDFETMDPLLKSHGSSWCYDGIGEAIGVSIATEGTATYYPLRHEEGNVESPGNIIAWLKDFCAQPGNTLVAYNLSYDLGWARREGIEIKCRIVDPGSAVALLDENRFSYSLDSVSRTYLKTEKVDLRPLADALGVGDIWAKLKRVHPALLSQYAERDARLTFDLWRVLQPKLRQEDLEGVFKLEMDLVPVLLDMRARGVRVDVERAESEEQRLKQEEADIKAELKRVTGLSVDIWSAGSVEGALLEAGITPPRTAEDRASITAPWLQSLDHEVPRMILRARRVNKLHSMYMRNYILEHQVDGRIHAQFSPLRGDAGGTVTGRLSSSSPNLQNLSARNPESAKVVRGCFLPEGDEQWASADWSSQEPRITVHFAALLEKVKDRRISEKLRGASEAAEEYRRNPHLDFHQFVADLAGIKRKQGKDINLGIAYSMGELKLCATLGLPTVFDESKNREVAGPEARAILDQYHERLPFMRGLSQVCTEMAESRGYIRTLLGRRRRFLMKGERGSKGDRRAFAFKALNALVQGSAADQTKKAMIDCHRAGIKILITLHDELGLSVKDRAEAEAAAEIMNKCVPLEVPMVVDLALGKTWGECT